MADQDEGIWGTNDEVNRLQSQVKALQDKGTRDQKRATLLLEAAINYRNAHAAGREDFQALTPGQPRIGHSLDQVNIARRVQMICSAQSLLFAAIDLVQEELCLSAENPHHHAENPHPQAKRAK